MSDDDEWTAEEESAHVQWREEYFAAHHTLRDKVRTMFGGVLDEKTFSLGSADRLQDIATSIYPDVPTDVLYDVVFHLTDWRRDGACLLALAAHPDRFTPMEIRAGLDAFLVHAPNHIAAAAKLSGHAIQDTFKLGELVLDADADEPFVM